MKPRPKPTVTVRLIDRKTRTVEVFGPPPFGSVRPTDRRFLVHPGAGAATAEEYFVPDAKVGLCFAGDETSSKFIIDISEAGERLLALLAKYPEAPARPAELHSHGYLVRG